MNTLRRQILALFILIATVFLIAVVYTLVLLQQIGTDLDQLNQIYIPLSEDIVQLEVNTQKLFIDTQESISIRDLESFDIDMLVTLTVLFSCGDHANVFCMAEERVKAQWPKQFDGLQMKNNWCRCLLERKKKH